uniref:Golgi associated RAB2 interactor protein-like Rab2B-binding domain-containing protein n=1 Tax=Podarcis muralis TaxID=64176 RepID=A0A670JXJ3_PODMU
MGNLAILPAKTTHKPSHIATKGLFNTAMGPLQRQLRSGEYNLFKCATMFESDFVQVSKRGGTLDVHNQVQMVRVAIAATSPGLQVPNVLLLARPIFPSRQGRHFVVYLRLLPLCFVKISIHDFDKQQLRFKMSTGRTFYLQLCPLPDTQESEFESWVKVVHLLRPPSDVSLKKEPVEDLWKPGQPALNATAVSSFGVMEVKPLKVGHPEPWECRGDVGKEGENIGKTYWCFTTF